MPKQNDVEGNHLLPEVNINARLSAPLRRIVLTVLMSCITGCETTRSTEIQRKEKRFVSAARLLLDEIINTNVELTKAKKKRNSAKAKKIVQAAADFREDIKTLPEASLNPTTIHCVNKLESLVSLLKREASIIDQLDHSGNVSEAVFLRVSREHYEIALMICNEIEVLRNSLDSV